jgi:cell division septum initiation protein DivIVA
MNEGTEGRWHPLSPDEIRRWPLRESGLGRRGYRPEDVQDLVARLADEVQRWSQAYSDSQAEIHRLREYYRNQGTEPAPQQPQQPQQPQAVSTEAVQILARAQAYADRLVADAQTQARNVQSDARAQAEEIIAQARQDAEEAVKAYRARAGGSYTPEGEEVERLAAWARSLLATVNAVQMQLAATGQAFQFELAKLDKASQPPPPDTTTLLSRIEKP